MEQPQLIVIVGCNAAGKSSFIRTRLNDLQGFSVIMTDVYKGRSKEVFHTAVKKTESIILETVFNDSSYKDLIDEARNANYHTSLIVLFLDSITQSIARVAFRSMDQSGLKITGGNIKINFNECFKNVAMYFFYFDQSEFIYTGLADQNISIMKFNKSSLTKYRANNLNYPQKFAAYSHQHQRLNDDAFQVITKNQDYPGEL